MKYIILLAIFSLNNTFSQDKESIYEKINLAKSYLEAGFADDAIDVYKNIPKNKIPDTESLKNTYERVVSYYTKNIEPLIQSRQNILISAHGNSLRALCKKLFNISEINISKLEIPTGNPLIIKFNKELKISDCYYLDITRSKDLLIKF